MLLLLLLLQPPPCLSLLLGLFCKLVRRITSHRHWLYSSHTLGLTGNRVQQGRLKYSVQIQRWKVSRYRLKGFPDNGSTWSDDAVAERKRERGTLRDARLCTHTHTPKQIMQYWSCLCGRGVFTEHMVYCMSPPHPALKEPSAV